MPISGLVLSLSAETRVEDVAAELSQDSRIEVGAAVGNRLPLVSETIGSDDDRELWERVRRCPGVLHVDVAFIHFDDPGAMPAAHEMKPQPLHAPSPVHAPQALRAPSPSHAPQSPHAPSPPQPPSSPNQESERP